MGFEQGLQDVKEMGTLLPMVRREVLQALKGICPIVLKVQLQSKWLGTQL